MKKRIYVILSNGTGIPGALVRWQTRGRYAHAAIFIDGVVYEAVTKGVRKAPITTEYSKWAYVEVTEEQHDKILNFLEKQVGKKYDFTMIARFVTRQQETRKSSGKWFCSELVYAALAVGGVNLFANTEPWEISPVMLSKSPLLTFW